MKHRFFLSFRDAHGATAFEAELTDFGALYHDLAFRAVCAGTRANDGDWGEARVEPVWNEAKLVGLRVRLDDVTQIYSRAVFADQATELLVAHYARDSATREDEADEPKWAGRIDVRHECKVEPEKPRRAFVRRLPYPLVERAQCPSAIRLPEPAGRRQSLAVASKLLADLAEASANSLEEERADFLTGYVVKDGAGAAAVIVLDRIPAEAATTKSIVHFGFSPQTFAAAQRVLDERGSGQSIVGWCHNHPPPCGRKCLMTVPACATANVFFSVADRTVHRRGFGNPYMVALVAGKGAHRRADDPVFRAFGWRNGMIRERSFTTFEGHDGEPRS